MRKCFNVLGLPQYLLGLLWERMQLFEEGFVQVGASIAEVQSYEE